MATGFHARLRHPRRPCPRPRRPRPHLRCPRPRLCRHQARSLHLNPHRHPSRCITVNHLAAQMKNRWPLEMDMSSAQRTAARLSTTVRSIRTVDQQSHPVTPSWTLSCLQTSASFIALVWAKNAQQVPAVSTQEMCWAFVRTPKAPPLSWCEQLCSPRAGKLQCVSNGLCAATCSFSTLSLRCHIVARGLSILCSTWRFSHQGGVRFSTLTLAVYLV